MSDKPLTMAEAVTREALAERPALAKRLAAEKEAKAPVAPPSADGQPRLDYSQTRPELGAGDFGAAYLDALSQPRGPALDREAPSGAEPDNRLEYPSRPELAGESRLEVMQKGNGLTLEETRAKYIREMADYRAHRRADRPYYCPQFATDYREQVALHGPYAPAQAPQTEDRVEP